MNGSEYMVAFEVIAGDFTSGYALSNGKYLKVKPKSNFFFEEKIFGPQIKSVNLVNQHEAKSFLGSAAMGLAGGALLGPLGLIAGAVAGGSSSKILFSVEFKDGRKLLGSCKSSDYGKIQQTQNFNSTQGKSIFSLLIQVASGFFAVTILIALVSDPNAKASSKLTSDGNRLQTAYTKDTSRSADKNKNRKTVPIPSSTTETKLSQSGALSGELKECLDKDLRLARSRCINKLDEKHLTEPLRKCRSLEGILERSRCYEKEIGS